MCSSACQSMEPSSSSRVICGTMMFLTMTELPETPAATRSVLNWCRLKTPEMTPDTSFSSMIWPSTTVSGRSPSKPRLTSESAPDLPPSSTSLTELEPMSRPTRPLLPSFFLNIAYPFLEDCDCRCRWSWRRRARARRTLACVVRHVCGACGLGVSDFISRGLARCAAWARGSLRRGLVLTLWLWLCASEGGSASRASARAREWPRYGSKNLPFGNPAESKLAVRLPSALRPTLTRGVPFSVEFQRRHAAGRLAPPRCRPLLLKGASADSVPHKAESGRNTVH